jgi:integrase
MAVLLALASGCRRGEVLGLSWGNVDLSASTVKITQQITHDGGLSVPKTKQSKRTITLDTGTVKRLKAWKVKQAEFLLSLGIGQGKATPVISNEIGGWQEPNGFSRWWRQFCASNGFEGLKFHALRHTHATLLISRNVDIKTVQGRLGHTKAGTTLDIYASIMPAKDKEAARVVGSILAAPAPIQGEVVNL